MICRCRSIQVAVVVNSRSISEAGARTMFDEKEAAMDGFDLQSLNRT
jgi:hypothetical protein